MDLPQEMLNMEVNDLKIDFIKTICVLVSLENLCVLLRAHCTSRSRSFQCEGCCNSFLTSPPTSILASLEQVFHWPFRNVNHITSLFCLQLSQATHNPQNKTRTTHPGLLGLELAPTYLPHPHLLSHFLPPSLYCNHTGSLTRSLPTMGLCNNCFFWVEWPFSRQLLTYFLASSRSLLKFYFLSHPYVK